MRAIYSKRWVVAIVAVLLLVLTAATIWIGRERVNLQRGERFIDEQLKLAPSDREEQAKPIEVGDIASVAEKRDAVKFVMPSAVVELPGPEIELVVHKSLRYRGPAAVDLRLRDKGGSEHASHVADADAKGEVEAQSLEQPVLRVGQEIISLKTIDQVTISTPASKSDIHGFSLLWQGEGERTVVVAPVPIQEVDIWRQNDSRELATVLRSAMTVSGFPTKDADDAVSYTIEWLDGLSEEQRFCLLLGQRPTVSDTSKNRFAAVELCSRLIFKGSSCRGAERVRMLRSSSRHIYVVRSDPRKHRYFVFEEGRNIAQGHVNAKAPIAMEHACAGVARMFVGKPK